MSSIKATEQTLLYKYLGQLATNPLRTKAITNATLNALQEILASYMAGERSKNGSYVSERVPKMMFYGAFVSAPLGHFLVTTLQKAFAGKTTSRDKLLQIVASNLIVAPIQNSVFLISMAIIAGARTKDQVLNTLKAGLPGIMRLTWISSPICLSIAQRFLPPEAWVPFFNLINFIFGTYINTKTKRQLRLKREADARKDQ